MMPWVLFNLGVLAMLALDLGVFHRTSHTVHMKEALTWTLIWIVMALGFNLGLYYWKGPDLALQFLTGYLIEKSLSIDNIFIFVLLFNYFRVATAYQHKVLFWGILGALLMRAVMIAMGTELLQRFDWVIYVFGGFLVITGTKMALQKEIDVHPEKNIIVRAYRRFFPVTDEYQGDRFFAQQAGRWTATPLFLVLLVVEATDLVFAVDSIPAIFAVSKDPFIVYTSNAFAILGLRALYFALAGVMNRFHYLKLGLAVVLVFVGIKMILAHHYPVPIGLALGVIASILTVSVAASLLRPATPTKN